MTLGAQANGMALVSKTLIALSACSTDIAYFHIQRGQILNFPLTEDGLIQASNYAGESFPTEIHPDWELRTLSLPATVSPNIPLRADFEPCWEADPRTVVIRVRKSGVIVATLNATRVIDTLLNFKATCNCRTPSSSAAEFPAEDGWRYLDAQGILTTCIKTSGQQPKFRAKPKTLIDCRGSDILTIFCAGLLMSTIIADPWYRYAHKEFMTRRSNAVVMLPSLGRME